MNLELITHEPTGPKKPVNLLFVHGICVGAWVWDRHFLPFFAKHGYRCHALSLRGHGKSPSTTPVRFNHLQEYVDDVRQVCAAINEPTVLIGHSFGGGVVQKYFQMGGKGEAMVLMASVPPYGLGLASWRTMVMNPLLWTKLAAIMTWGVATMDPGVIRKMVFSNSVPDAVFMDFLSRVGEPPIMASMELMGWPPLAPMPGSGGGRVLVIGGDEDMFVPETDVRWTAFYYGTKPVILKKTAHAMMLEPTWQEPAGSLLAWLESQFVDV
ncbi:MAG: alpha/beta hydrolase [Magnetococcales bacterium]|nr:alpha/beta hydrolase [Magnetococcales bacterium]MBF0151223.1 alpha/beta hydrolase [Magnetococcales bacterium]MBF0348825.1 alpha/beta hydrolase [Magnetococcales bacterium]